MWMHVITESVIEGFKNKNQFSDIYDDIRDMVSSSILDAAGSIAQIIHGVEGIETCLAEDEINQKLLSFKDFFTYWTEENMGDNFLKFKTQFIEFLSFLENRLLLNT